METKNNSGYLGNREWLKDVVVEPVVLRGISALEYMGYFSGWVNENEIDVYHTEKGKYTNITYHVVKDFSAIDFTEDGHIRCSTFTQAINDLLAERDVTDEQVLMESLNDYYEEHGHSFDGLRIEESNEESFREISRWAREYYYDR